tara:strand:+ start:624 stop:1043 length:420 start_codon:yes stop_codon:yes gene_type:complete
VTKKKNISQKDINTWKNYIKNPTDLTDKDNVKSQNDLNNSRYKYDLHGFTLIEANEKVKKIILSCVDKNYKEILLITGKGIHSNTEKDVYVSKDLSKLRYSVPEYINSNLGLSKHIISISEADKKNGGDGAIIIKLKRL